MTLPTHQELLEAGVHFGHLSMKWNPKMAPYIFMEKNGIHIIDLNKSLVKLEEAAHAAKQMAKSGKKILFVATKKQAKEVVTTEAKRLGMPYITERWPGGMLTNFATVRKSVKKMTGFEKMATDGTFENISKKERLQITRQKAKLEKFLGSIADLARLPAAIFIVDIMKEHIAVAEAMKLNIPTLGIVDTNSNPNLVDFAIPGNDDATTSITLIVRTIAAAIEEGLAERKEEKEMDKDRESPEKDEVTAEEKTLSAVEEDDDAGVVIAKTAGKVEKIVAESDKPKRVRRPVGKTKE